MIKPDFKTYSSIAATALILLAFFYLAIFGRALRQQENHLGITLALPKVIITSKAVPIDGGVYLAADPGSFIRLMERQGYSHINQLGSVYVFVKDGKRYMSSSRMYSSYFMLFTAPAEQ